jgi:hypothetical protein
VKILYIAAAFLLACFALSALARMDAPQSVGVAQPRIASPTHNN